MLKRLTLRLFILFVLCVALTAVSFTPASAAKRQIYCAKFIDGTGQCIVMCCTDTGECISSTC
jgi:hypothetical protein